MSNYFNRPNPLGLAVSAVKNVFKSRGKNPTPGTAINKVPPNVPKTKLDKSKSNLNKAIQKGKATSAKLKQTQFEIKNPKFKGKDFTFATSKKKTESNKEAYKRIQGENTKAIKSMVDEAFKGKKTKVFKAPENFNKGGRVGLKGGSFPDLSGDGEVTKEDILIGRGVIPKPKNKKKKTMMAKKSETPMDKAVKKDKKNKRFV